MRSVVLMAGLALAGCSADEVRGPEFSPAYAREFAEREVGAPQACLSTFGNQNVRAIDARTLAYDAGRTIYVSRLKSACPALSPDNAIIVERNGSQLCRGDHVRGLEPGAIIPGPVCIVQDWVPYRMR